MKGLYINLYPVEWVGVRVAVNIGQLEAHDSAIRDKGGEEIERKERNLSFRTKLFEAYGALEIYPSVFSEGYDGLFHKLRPYGLIGAGIFHYNPDPMV